MAQFRAGPSLPEIIIRNWSLDEFIDQGYLDGSDLYLGNRLQGGVVIPELILSGDSPEVLRIWAREINPSIEILYNRLGWNRFKDDLVTIYHNPGRLFHIPGKYSVWYRKDDDFIIIIGGRTFQILTVTSFEDVFLNIISLRGDSLEIVDPFPLEETYTPALESLYFANQSDVDQLTDSLEEGKMIQIRGFPNNMTVSPITEMVTGYLFINEDYQFVLIGTTMTLNGRETVGDVFTHEDGQRILSSLVVNKENWKYITL